MGGMICALNKDPVFWCCGCTCPLSVTTLQKVWLCRFEDTSRTVVSKLLRFAVYLKFVELTNIFEGFEEVRTTIGSNSGCDLLTRCRYPDVRVSDRAVLEKSDSFPSTLDTKKYHGHARAFKEDSIAFSLEYGDVSNLGHLFLGHSFSTWIIGQGLDDAPHEQTLH